MGKFTQRKIGSQYVYIWNISGIYKEESFTSWRQVPSEEIIKNFQLKQFWHMELTATVATAVVVARVEITGNTGFEGQA